MIAGTVFREPGFAVPGAEVVLMPEDAPKKSKRQLMATDARGEFAFRVRAEKATYKVAVAGKGLISQSRIVEVRPNDRIEVTFMLVAESNK